MAKKLTSVEAAWQRTVLHDIFEAGGLIKRSARTAGTTAVVHASSVEAAKKVCEEIKFRNFDFYAVDAALEKLARLYYTDIHSTTKERMFNRIQIANMLAAFCAEQEIFWDDVNTSRTTVEMDTYRKSALGGACWEFNCFLSQQKPVKASSGTSARKPLRAPRAAGAAPKSGYKSSGPKSGEIKGLIGTPGEKIMLTGKNLVVICCDSSKPKAQYVFVDPLAYRADINKVKLGDPSGYSACKLFFDSISTAETAIEGIKRSITIPDHITGFTLKKQAADPNGYFKIDTEVGPAYIKASKLNEEIKEEMTEDASKAVKSRFPEIGDIDVYSEAMHRYE